MISGGYVVTNAHVVWPFATARLVFPDGSEFLEVPVVGMDMMVDLAVLGPIDVDAVPLDLIDGEGIGIGTEVYLVGYPGEVEQYPQPTITRGLVSRMREWEAIPLTYFQTDAAIAGGQSGGALVSDRGEVIGISGFTFSDVEFGLVTSSADVAPRIQQLISGGDPSGLGARSIDTGDRGRRHEVALSNWWDQRAFLLEGRSGTSFDIEVSGDAGAGMAVYDSLGTELVFVDEIGTSGESASLGIEHDEPHTVVIWHSSETPSSYVVETSSAVAPIDDPDDASLLMIGETAHGSIDYPGDTDHYLVLMDEGESLKLTVTAALIDPFLTVDFHGAAEYEVIVDDDSGGGLFGVDSQIVYSAPHTGSYFVVIHDLSLQVGGYVVSVEPAGPEDELTGTTLAGLREVAEDPKGADADSGIGFGLPELRQALAGLPESFEEVDPTSEEIGLGDLGLLEDASSVEIAYVSTDPFALVYATAGRVTDDERAMLVPGSQSEELFLLGFSQGLLEAVGDSDEVTLHDSGLLDLPSIGDGSIGVFVDMTMGFLRLDMEVVIFRRRDIAGGVLLLHFLGNEPDVSVEDVASMVDSAMIDFLGKR